MDNGSETVRERIIRIEEQMKHFDTYMVQSTKSQHQVAKTLQCIDMKVDQITREMIRYKGFVGGIAFVLSGIGAMILFFKTWLFTKLGLSL